MTNFRLTDVNGKLHHLEINRHGAGFCLYGVGATSSGNNLQTKMDPEVLSQEKDKDKDNSIVTRFEDIDVALYTQTKSAEVNAHDKDILSAPPNCSFAWCTTFGVPDCFWESGRHQCNGK